MLSNVLFSEVTDEFEKQRKLIDKLRSNLAGCSGEKMIQQQTALTQALIGFSSLAETIAKLNTYQD